jgi:hypothetical protein
MWRAIGRDDFQMRNFIPQPSGAMPNSQTLAMPVDLEFVIHWWCEFRRVIWFIDLLRGRGLMISCRFNLPLLTQLNRDHDAFPRTESDTG